MAKNPWWAWDDEEDEAYFLSCHDFVPNYDHEISKDEYDRRNSLVQKYSHRPWTHLSWEQVSELRNEARMRDWGLPPLGEGGGGHFLNPDKFPGETDG